jgi:hypothetical protein
MPTVVALVLFGLAALLSPQSPPPQAPPPARDNAVASRPASTGVIRGRVITTSGEPIRRATVMLIAAELKASRNAATDADGRFEFQHLPPATVTVTVTKAGFVTTSYGQKRPFQSGRAIELAAAQVLDKFEFVMPRASVIAGRVINDLGEPSPGVTAFALRRRFVNGTPSVAIAGVESTTDDLGQYRLSGLPAGSYYVMTSRPGGLVEVGIVPRIRSRWATPSTPPPRTSATRSW